MAVARLASGLVGLAAMNRFVPPSEPLRQMREFYSAEPAIASTPRRGSTYSSPIGHLHPVLARCVACTWLQLEPASNYLYLRVAPPTGHFSAPHASLSRRVTVLDLLGLCIRQIAYKLLCLLLGAPCSAARQHDSSRGSLEGRCSSSCAQVVIGKRIS